MNLLELANIIDHELVIRYYPNQNQRFVANFEHAELKDGTILSGTYGEGRDPLEALNSYGLRIAGKRLVFNAMDRERRQEFMVPPIDTLELGSLR